MITTNTQALTTLQTYKGWLYVFITGLGLFYLIKKYDKQVKEQELKQENLQDRLESEKELKDILFERIPVMITIYDPDLEEFHINREFEKILGWSGQDIKEGDIDLLEVCYPTFKIREEAVKFMNRPGVGWKEFPMVTKSGDKIPTSWTNVKLTDNTSVGIGIDMTEIKASQAKIRESQKLLKKTIESLKASLIVVDPESRTIIECNKSTEEMFGYDREELIGSSTRILHINDQTFNKFDDIGAEALKHSGIFQTEFKMQKKDGTQIYTDHTVSLVYDPDGEIDRIVSIVRDITKQKRYQKELEERNNFIETTIENLPIGVAVNTIDDGQVTLMNQKFSEIYGWPEEVLNDIDSFFENVFSGDEFRIKSFLADIESKDPERMQWENLTIKNKEGDKKIVHAKNIPLFKQNYMISTVIDFTEQKTLERKLRESEEKYRHLFERNPQPMWIVDPESLEFAEVNLAAIEHYGYTEDEFLNMKVSDIRVDSFEEIKSDIRKYYSNNKYSREFKHVKKNGERIDVHIAATDLRYNTDNIYWLVLANDVTEQKKMQEKIIQSILEGEDRERKRIAHELHDGLGQYLVAANMNFESIKGEVRNLREKRHNQFKAGLSYLKKALSETRSIAHNLMPKAIADYGLIAALENLLQDLRSSTNITITFNSNFQTIDLLNQAAVNLYRILQEIISNAVRHADCTSISIVLERKNNTLKLRVTDDGKGFDPEIQNSDGLGLQSIQNRVTNLKGSLQINSETGEGTKISVTIPDISVLLQNGDD